ncbi:MAG: response regulator [Candidatus Omnitrophica bacterium]|nr:response regulator [Candidatus Omnitrophota bacterium]
MAVAKILVVEDNPFMTKLLESRLRANDYEVCSSPDGKDALQKICANRPDLILLDVNMPQMNGFDTARELKADIATSHIPIIFVTAKGEEKDVLRGIEAGAVTFIIKPFKPEVLLDEINKALDKTKS